MNARETDVAAGRHVVVERHSVAVDADALDLQDGVGAGGHGGAGRDADRLAVSEPVARGCARAGLAGDLERAARRARLHGVAVHRRVGEGRDVVGGDDGLGEEAAERVLHGEALGRQWRDGACDGLAGLGDGEQ